ncbi:MAG: DUF523 domain-containing protein [Candidatus Cloacimonadales bacterium]
MILVSACLAGIKCRYDGKDNKSEYVIDLVRKGQALPVCPEQLGGLPTPRLPAEQAGGEVITAAGDDYTAAFQKGAEETLRLAQLSGAERAILKQRSPSCGSTKIYDGNFRGKVIAGQGITAKLLAENGIAIISEEDL